MTDKTEKAYEFGLYISKHYPSHDRHNPRITVSIVRKDDDGDWPCNVNDTRTARWDRRCPKRLHGLNLQDLGMGGQCYTSHDEGNVWIAYEPRYRNVTQVELRDAESMFKTLKAFERALEKWRKVNGYSISPAQMLAIFAKFVGAKFVVYRDETSNTSRGWSYRDNCPWNFMPISLGIDKYRDEIAKLCRDYVDHDRVRV